MKIIAPVAVTDDKLISSNVPENDFPQWNVGVTYAEGAQVIVLATHRVYRSVQSGNLGNDPTTSSNIWWVEVSATNRWKAFDTKIADKVTHTTAINYVIEAPSLITGLAFLNVTAAQIRVRIIATDTTTIFDQTYIMADGANIIDWFTFFTEPSPAAKTDLIVPHVPAYPGYQINVTIGVADTQASVGEIVLGRMNKLGDTLEGTEIGLTSFSTKEQDVFGNWTIVSRAKSDPVDFRFAVPAGDVGRVRRVLTEVRDKPAVYFTDEDLVDIGGLTYGLFQEFRIPLVSRGITVINLEIEGLT